MNIVTATLARLLGLALCAAFLVLEHVRFLLRASRRGPDRARRIALAALLPGYGPVYAWRHGARVAPVLYVLLAVGYVLLRYLP